MPKKLSEPAKGRKEVVYVAKPDLPPLDEVVASLQRLWDSRILTNAGPNVERFEKELQSFLGAKHVDVTVNGTLALQLALHTLPRRGEVITTPFTFAATTTALLWEGFLPRFADVNPRTFNLNADSANRLVNKNTVAILPVHVFGNPTGANDLAHLGHELGIPVIFDAAHAFGVTVRGRSVLRLGSISTLSFHATKAFHTFEGGGLVTNSASLSRKIRLLRNFGITDEEHVEIPGINAKMNEFCAVMGILNLKHFPKWQNQRSRLYKMYIDLLGHCGKLDFQSIPTEGYNYSYMPVIFADRRQRDYVHDRLVASGIKPRKYFFPATNDLSMQGFSSRDSTPVARNISLRILTLPLYASLEEEIVDNICDIVLQALS